MRRLRLGWNLGLLLVVLCPTAALAAPRERTLPLSRVRLYETGVGYFERAGVVPAGDIRLRLPIPAGHLDDALKTLVVLGGDVKVNGVAFSSSVSREMARKLAGLPEEGDEPLGFSALARSFKGAQVVLGTATGNVEGRLVEVLDPGQSELERCAAPGETSNSEQGACRLVERGSVVVLTAAGALVRLPTAEVTSVRPTEPAARARLDTALTALSQRGAQTQRDLSVLSSTGGNISLGYVAEAPVWRSTYRVVLAADRAKIQGWALIHNDTDEDWQSVQVDLVNGRPTSFLYPLAGPRYARRELVTPPDALSSVPQLFDTTVDNLWTGEAGGLGLEGVGAGGGGRGEGLGLGIMGTLGHGAGTGGDSASDELSVGNLASLAPAEGVEAAALFRYSLPEKVALKAHASALVPFLSTFIKVRQIAWFGNDADAAASALHVTNDTAQTLPAGTLSVFSAGGFAGETLLPRSKPKQSHLLSYGLDLDVTLERTAGDAVEEPRLFDFDGERLTRHYVRKRGETLHLENRSQSARRVYVELNVVDNAQVTGAELGRDTDTHKTYVMVDVPARQELSRELRLEEGLQHQLPFDTLPSSALFGFAEAPSTKKDQQVTLRHAAEQLLSCEKRLGALPKREAELTQAVADVARVRENARILGATHAEQAEAMARRVVELEGLISALRTRIAELRREADGFKAGAKRELWRLSSR